MRERVAFAFLDGDGAGTASDSAILAGLLGDALGGLALDSFLFPAIDGLTGWQFVRQVLLLLLPPSPSEEREAGAIVGRQVALLIAFFVGIFDFSPDITL